MKRFTLLAVAFSLVFCGAGVARADDSAKLQSVKVKFVLPKGDDKDSDTKIAVDIKKSDLAIASADNVAGEKVFSDPGTYGPYDVPVKTAVTKADYRGSTTTLTVTPDNNDHWKTNTIIEAAFDDGTTLTSESGEAKISDENKVVRFTN